MPTKDLTLRITGDSSSAERALARAEAAQRRFDLTVMKARREMDTDFSKSEAERAAALSRGTASLDKAGTAFLGFGAAVGVGLGLATREAMQWESAWAGVTKTVDGSTEQMAELEEGLRDLALVLPASHQEIAAVAEAAGALGVQRSAILGFTRTMIDLGETTDLTADEAATSIAQLANVMGTDLQTEVDNFGSALVALGNDGASTESQILAMAQRIGGAGKTIGLSEQDVLGFASALSSAGIEAEAGGSAISRVFIDIADSVASGKDTLSTFATTAGMTTAEFSKAFGEDPARAVQSFVEGLGSISTAGGNVFGILDNLGLSDIRVRDALLRMANGSDLLADALNLSGEAWATHTALAEEAAKRYETTEAKVQLAKNALSDAAIEIGEHLLPVLADMAGAVSDMARWFSELPGPVKGTATALAALVTVGLLAAGAGLKMHAAFGRVQTQLAATPRLAAAATVGMKGLGAASVALGIVAVALAVEKMFLAIENDVVSTKNLTADLIRLTQAGKQTAEMTEKFGKDMSDLGPQLEDAAHGFDLAIGPFGKESTRQNIDRLAESMAEMVANGDIEAATDMWIMASEAGEEFGVSTKEMTELFAPYHEAVERSRIDTGLLAEEQDNAAESTKDLTPAQEELAAQFGLTGQEAKDAADDLDDFNRELGEIMDQLFATEEAQDATASAWSDLRQAMADAAEAGETWDATLEGNSEAALRNRETNRELIGTYVDQIATWDTAAMSSAEYDAALRVLRDDFIANADKAGLAEEAVALFDKAMALLPPKVDIPITTTAPEAQQGVISLQDEIDMMHGRTIEIWLDPRRNTNPLWDFVSLGGPTGQGAFGSESNPVGAGGARAPTGGAPAERGARAGTFSIPAGRSSWSEPWGAAPAGGSTVTLAVTKNYAGRISAYEEAIEDARDIEWGRVLA